MIQYKYKLTLQSGETKEFICEHAPESLHISKGIFNNTYSLKTSFQVVYGNVIHFELLGKIGDYTKEELMIKKSDYIILKLVWELTPVMALLGLLILSVKVFAGEFFVQIPKYMILILIPLVMFSYLSVRYVLLNKKWNKKIEEYVNHNNN